MPGGKYNLRKYLSNSCPVIQEIIRDLFIQDCSSDGAILSFLHFLKIFDILTFPVKEYNLKIRMEKIELLAL